MAISIADLLPTGVQVEVTPSKFLEVYPLTMQHIALLVQTHESDVREMLTSNKPDFTKILTTSPVMAAQIIAMSSRTIGQEDDILKLPATAQLDLLLSIWEVSVPNVKKLLSKLERLVGDVRVAQTEIMQEKLQMS